MLTHEEAQRLRREAPSEFDRRALEERSEFLFGVIDCRDRLGREWGGEFRVPVNQNVVLHFVPRHNDEMRTVDELPQFVVFPDDDRAGEDQVHTYEAVKDLEAFDGVVFYVAQEEYRGMVRELGDVSARYGDHPRLPDTLYAAAAFVRMITTRVLEHPVVAAERPYDFRKRAY